MSGLNVYVPSWGPTTRHIARGSGVVGSLVLLGGRRVYYEGNLYGAVNLGTWIDRVRHAAGRLVTRYPTVAVADVDQAELYLVGKLYRAGTRDAELDLIDFPGSRFALAWWLKLGTLAELDTELTPTP